MISQTGEEGKPKLRLFLRVTRRRMIFRKLTLIEAVRSPEIIFTKVGEREYQRVRMARAEARS